ncbi:MAG: RNA methyltransferase [Brumimicrobium sp.]|nr:RNA methyltransferase [Brumimicrobium sp.]MCO5268821.1 RNA methyltransferase [Brumimicrobium sp.]
MISKERIKYIRTLHQKKFRDQHHQFIIEGAKLLEEALMYAPQSIQQIYSTEELPFKSGLPINIISEKELSQISMLQHPQKIIAVCDYLPIHQKRPDFYVVLDTIQDPGNLGTILRLCSWFGVFYILSSKESVDIYNPKVVQASMGAIFNVQIEYCDLKEELKQITLPIYGALLEGENIYTVPKERKGVLVMGNEGNGIHTDLLSFISHPITIPKFGKGESLNVAMATAILLSEFSRK